jgi:probable rRNA maturation factor
MPKIHLRADGAYRQQIDPGHLREAAFKTLKHENAPRHTELTLAITGDDEIRALNHKHRGMDAPTDVLSFGERLGGDAASTRFVAAPGEPTYLGDVVISYPRAKEQAASAGHPVANEMLLLVVHGVLHLLGHDHVAPGEKRKMWAAQAEILQELGVQVKINEL